MLLYLPHQCDVHSLTRWYNELISRGNNEKWCKLYRSLCLFLYRSCWSVACIGARFVFFFAFTTSERSLKGKKLAKESLFLRMSLFNHWFEIFCIMWAKVTKGTYVFALIPQKLSFFHRISPTKFYIRRNIKIE